MKQSLVKQVSHNLKALLNNVALRCDLGLILLNSILHTSHYMYTRIHDHVFGFRDANDMYICQTIQSYEW